MSICCIVILIHTEASAPWCFIILVLLVAPDVAEQGKSTSSWQSRIKLSLICCCIFICVFMLFLVIGAMCIGLFFSFIPSENQFYVLDRPGDTVLVQIPQLKWMQSIDAHLLSSSCSGSMMAVNCDRIEPSDKRTGGLNASDGIYLIQPSSPAIAFNVSRVADKNFRVWLFPSLVAAENAVKSSYSHLTSCSNPPENIYCGQVYETTKQSLLPFTVSLSSYYYLRCQTSDDTNCSAQITIADGYLNTYDFAKTKQYAIDHAVLNVRPHVELRLRNSTLSFEPVCVLAQLNNDPDCAKDVSQIDITSTRRDDIVKLVTLIWVIILIVFLVIIVVAAIRYCRQYGSSTAQPTGTAAHCQYDGNSSIHVRM